MRRSRSKAPRPPLPPGFGVIWTTVAIDLVGFGIVVPILPQYADDFGLSATVIGLLMSSFSLAQLVCAPLLGRLSDRIGRKPILLFSLFGTALGSLLTGVAGSVWILLAGRLLDGASGASVSVAQAAVADLAPPRQRARLMGLLGAAFGVGFVAGPAIGALAALGGPHIPFFVAAAIAFVNGLIAIKRLPETRGLAHAVEHEVGDAAGATGVAGAAAGAGTAAERAEEAEADGERLAAVPGLDGPGIAEPAHLASPAGGSPAARRTILRLIGVSFVGMIAFSAFEATFALLVSDRFGLHLSSTAALFAVIGVVLVVVQGGLVGPVVERMGEADTLRTALVCNALGLALLAVDLGWAFMSVAVLLLVVGQGLLTPTLSSSVASLAGAVRGKWLGWQQSAGGVARVVGPAAGGALFEHVAPGAPYAAGAVVVLVAVSLLPRLKGSARPTGVGG